MQKVLTIITLTLGICSVQGYSQSNEAQQGAKGYQPTHAAPAVDPEQTGRRSLQSEPEKNVNADVRVVSAPAKDLYDKASFCVGIALAVTGIFGIVAALMTLKAINRQAALMERQITSFEANSEKQLRAYVHIDAAALKFPNPRLPEAQIHFKNCGQTPAYNVRGWIHTWVEAHPLTAILPLPPDNLIQGIEAMAPGRVSVFVSPPKPPLLGFICQNLGTIQATFYVYGELTYEDVFGKTHCTKYRLIYGGVDGVRRAPNGIDWVLSPDTYGNEST